VLKSERANEQETAVASALLRSFLIRLRGNLPSPNAFRHIIFFLFLDQLINVPHARARRVPIIWEMSRNCVPLGGGAVFGWFRHIHENKTDGRIEQP